MSLGQRNYQRFLAQRLGGASVYLEGEGIEHCTLVDISVGGLRILFERPLAHGVLSTGCAIQGKVVIHTPPSDIVFTGKVAWNKSAPFMGEPATLVGVCFADYTPLPESLLRLVSE